MRGTAAVAEAPELPSFLGPPTALPRPQPDVFYDAAADADRSGRVGNFAVDDQRQTLWCWAAIGAALLLKYRGTAVTQCEVASRFAFSDGSTYDCCGADRARCNEGLSFTTVVRDLGHLAGDPSAAVGFEQIADEIDLDQPVCVRVFPSGGGIGHVIAISGYSVVSGGRYLQIHDPADNAGQPNVADQVPFETLQDYYFGRPTSWTHTYFTAQEGD